MTSRHSAFSFNPMLSMLVRGAPPSGGPEPSPKGRGTLIPIVMEIQNSDRYKTKTSATSNNKTKIKHKI